MCRGTMQLCASISCSLGPGVWGGWIPKTTKCTLCLLLEHLHSQEQVTLFIKVTLSAPWPLGSSRRPPGPPETLKTPLLSPWDPEDVPLALETKTLFGRVQWESCSPGVLVIRPVDKKWWFRNKKSTFGPKCQNFEAIIAYFRPEWPIWVSPVNIFNTKEVLYWFPDMRVPKFCSLPKILGFWPKVDIFGYFGPNSAGSLIWMPRSICLARKKTLVAHNIIITQRELQLPLIKFQL